MKAQLSGNYKRGVSTLEILIAFALFALMITAVFMVIFGNQSVSVDTQTNNEALYKAQGLLEQARAASRQDFNSVVSTTTVSTSTIPYTLQLTVADLTQCKKQASGVVTYTEQGRAQTVTLTTFLSDIAGALALGGDCNSYTPTGGWTAPATLVSRDLTYKVAYGDNPLVNSAAGNQGTYIGVLRKMIYMTAGVSAAVPKDDFFIFDSSNILSGVIPPIVGSLNTGPGLNALDVEYNQTTDKTYVYVVQNDNQKQFEIVDVSTPAAPVVIASTTLPNITFTCSPAASPCLAGTSVYYYDGKVYVGTAYIANLALPSTQNNEFYIYCVSPDPAYPTCVAASHTNPVIAGSVNVNHNVNAITVRGRYAYLATSDDAGELTVIDLNNLASSAIKFNAPGNEDADSLYLIGNKLYLGRDQTPSSRKDFYVLDIGKLPTITELGSKYLNQNSNTKVSGIAVSGIYAFLALTDQTNGFEVLDISSTTNMTAIGKFNYSEAATAIVFANNFIFTSNKKNDALRIIRPAECSDLIDDDSDGRVDIVDPQCHTDGNANNTSSYNPEDDTEN